MQKRTFSPVVLTARSGSRSHVDGIEAGADNYLEKPFGFVELIARIRCVLRRAPG